MRRRRRRRPGLRHSSSFVASLALHAALLALVSVRACAGDASPVVVAPSARLVDVELAAVVPPPQPKLHPTVRAGGGVPNPSPHAPAHRAERPTPQRVALSPEEPHGREAAVAVAVDAVAAPSRPVEPAPPVAGPPGSGPGAHGGPGGPGAGQGGGPPLVTGNFAFGGAALARFKGVACFIPPGTLRIADVRGCVPVATFYTNSFDVRERQQVDGFPGITDRATWFMIEYTGVFTVARDGRYAFRLHSDDGSYLFIDGQQVIDNDGKHEPWSRRGSIQLAPGEHHLKLLYAQTTDRMALQLYVRVPGGREELFTPRI
jgi:hypothetical protein